MASSESDAPRTRDTGWEILVERSVCPGCESARGTSVYEMPYSSPTLRAYLSDFYGSQGAPDPSLLDAYVLSIRECDKCGLIFQKFAPSEVFSHTLYEVWIEPSIAFELDRASRDFAFYAAAAREIFSLKKHFDRHGIEHPRTLDYGMGWGEWALIAQSLGMDVVGVDFSEARLAHARRTGLPVATLEELHDEPPFDLINLEQVLEHLSEPLTVLSQLRLKLAPGGLMKINVPDGAAIKARLEAPDWGAPKSSPRSLNPIAPLEHLNCFHHESLLTIVRNAGLEPVRMGVGLRYAAIINSNQPLSRQVRDALAPLLRYWIPARTTYLWARARAT